MITASNMRVLIVDDNEDDYQIIRHLLARAHGTVYDLEWVSTYDEAVRVMEENRHDIYLVDYCLGQNDGLELLKIAKKGHHSTPVIVLTGQGDHSVDLKAMKSGASAFLIKGQFDEHLLERSIRYALERKQSEKQIIAMAHHDCLTGLPNRTLFNDHLNIALAQSHRTERIVAVFFIDLDNFKQINDSLGHQVGDLLISGISERLKACFRGSDLVSRVDRGEEITTLARWGGDEFILLLTNIKDRSDVIRVAERVVEAISQPFVLEAQEVQVTSSIGIAIYPHDCSDAGTLIKYADISMYAAKETGKNQFKLYSPSLALKKNRIESELYVALERGEFQLNYLPLIDISSGKLRGVEGLLRWHHSEKGIMYPAEFLPMAEEAGLMETISKWVIKTACIQGMVWQKAGLPPVNISVNLSCWQFRQNGLENVIVNTLGETGLEPGHLELEITESLMMQDFQAAISTLNNLRALGIRFSVDDFGTGYSSISNLTRFPINTLKIDRSFIKNVSTNNDDKTVSKLIIAMAKALNLNVVAEGVETNEQLDFLLDHGCTAIQGYLLSPPVSADHITGLLIREAKGEGVGVAACKSFIDRQSRLTS